MNKSKKIPENTLRQMKIKSTTFPNLWNAAKEVLRGKFIVIQVYLKKTRKISNKQPTWTSNGIRKKITNKAQNQKKEGNIKDQKGNK